MEPREATEAEIDYWAKRNGRRIIACMCHGTPDAEGTPPYPALVEGGRPGLFRFAYQLNKIELADLAQGGTLWLTIRNTSAADHLLQVIPSETALSLGFDADGVLAYRPRQSRVEQRGRDDG